MKRKWWISHVEPYSFRYSQQLNLTHSGWTVFCIILRACNVKYNTFTGDKWSIYCLRIVWVLVYTNAVYRSRICVLFIRLFSVSSSPSLDIQKYCTFLLISFYDSQKHFLNANLAKVQKHTKANLFWRNLWCSKKMPFTADRISWVATVSNGSVESMRWRGGYCLKYEITNEWFKWK